MSLLKFNKLFRNQNQRGFSLVELMIALTILAFFAVGIVSAFSGAFQAMADSKYRTVATNLAQQKLEEVKNLASEEYPFFRSYEASESGIDYIIQVVAYKFEKDDVNTENYAEVTATVEWHDRKGVRKFVQLLTNVYDLKIDKKEEPQDIGDMNLEALPVEMICCLENQISTITAEVFDKENKRYAVTGTPVLFSVSEGGLLSDEIALTDTIGRATTEVSIIDGYSTATVKAVCGPTTKTVTVTCKTIPKTIILSSDPSNVVPGGTSKITATVKDSCGNNLDAGSEQVTVAFATDYGYFDDSLTTKQEDVTTTNGVATINLHMPTSASGETATVTGTVTPGEGDLFTEPLTDTVKVFCTDYSIKLVAEKDKVFPSDSTKITATLTQNGVPSSSGTILFNTDLGNLSHVSQGTDSNGEAIVFLSNVPGDSTATITAEFKVPGTENSIFDSIKIKSFQYIITIQAEPNKIIPDGTSLITATLTDYKGNPATDRLVEFFRTKGSLSEISVYTNSYGIATTTLSGLKSGDKAEITATFGGSGDTSAMVIVDCVNYILTISANQTHIHVGEKSTITANLKNAAGRNQNRQTVTFSTTSGTLNYTTRETDSSGNAKVELTMNTVGTAIVTAKYSYGETTIETSIEITYTDTYLTLVSGSPTVSRTGSSGSSYDTLSFEIKLNGGPLVIDSVLADWTIVSNNPTKYEYIRITSPTSGTEREIYNQIIDNRDNEQPLDSSFEIRKNNTFRIRMRFNSGINSTSSRTRSFFFTLNPDHPNADYYYKVSFQIPRN